MAAVVSEVFGIRARGGLHVPAARLWLDGSTRHGLGFLAEYDGRRRDLARVVCSPVLAALVGTPGRKPLAVPYGRPFQLGRIAAELLPAGSSPGAAMLRAHLDGRAVLFAGTARPDALPTAEPAAWRDTDVLVLDAERALHSATSVADLAAEVDAAVAAVTAGLSLTWLCDEPSLAFDVCALVAGRSRLLLSPALRGLARRYATAGLGLPGAPDPGRPKSSAALRLCTLRELRWADRLPGQQRWLLAADAGEVALGRAGAARGLTFSRRAAGLQVDALARASGAGIVVATGAGAAALCARLEAEGRKCYHLQGEVQLRLV